MKVKLIKMINQAVKKEVPEYIVLKKIRDIVKDIPSFNVREKAWLYRLLKKIADLMYIQNGKLYKTQIRMYISRVNSIEEHARSRKKRTDFLETMMFHRANYGVFYICSVHSNPAEDHKDYQGKIYVDRFWKDILKDLPETRKKVAAYIRNHDLRTVQEIKKAPVYLTTRRYCKHFFISLGTDEVLNNGLKGIIKNHSELKVKDKPQDNRRIMNKIVTVLESE